MMSLRCKIKVKEELDKLGLKYESVELGEVEIVGSITPEQKERLGENLLKSGLELMEDKKSILVERTKNAITEIIHYADEAPKINYSEYISKKVGYDYTQLSSVFSEVNGITLQQYIINNKIERVKELLLYEELTLSEIAFKLRYSSVAHLSNQFRKITGMTPSAFRQQKLQVKAESEN
jgi:AraC-like DNA-binding protein